MYGRNTYGREPYGNALLSKTIYVFEMPLDDVDVHDSAISIPHELTLAVVDNDVYASSATYASALLEGDFYIGKVTTTAVFTLPPPPPMTVPATVSPLYIERVSEVMPKPSVVDGIPLQP